jgi:hypothetical protein
MRNIEIYKNMVFMSNSHPSALMIKTLSTEKMKHPQTFQTKEEILEAFYFETKMSRGNAVLNFRLKEKKHGLSAKGTSAVLPTDLFEEIIQGRRS